MSEEKKPEATAAKPPAQAAKPAASTSKAMMTPVDELTKHIDRMSSEFATLLPANVSLEKFVRTLKTAVRTNPRLVACNRQSLYAEAMKCATDGLIPDGREAALVPFRDDAKYLPMPAGICKRARNSGEIATIDALTVFEKDEYHAWVDEKGQHFRHEKHRGGDRGKPILTYAFAITKDGALYFEEMDARVIEAIKKMALAKAGGKPTPWGGPFEDEMWRKSALHRLCKYRLPSSSDMEEVLHREDDLFETPGKDAEKPADPAASGKANTPSRVGRIIEAQSEEHPAEQEPPAESAAPTNEEVPI